MSLDPRLQGRIWSAAISSEGQDADTAFYSPLRAGDVVLCATDGYSDNVFPEELEQLVSLVRQRYDEQTANPDSTDKTESPPRTFAKTLADVAVNFARLCSSKVRSRLASRQGEPG